MTTSQIMQSVIDRKFHQKKSSTKNGQRKIPRKTSIEEKRSQHNKKKPENTFRWSQIKYVRPTFLLDDVVEM